MEPIIMPFQDQPFNGDTFIAEEFLRLKHEYGLVNAVETGTALGGTTLFLSNNFEKVYTIEINETYHNIAKQKFISHKNIELFKGDSATILTYNLNKLSNRTIYFLDAHWQASCPLLNELQAIAHAGLRPIITIHDFKVPGEPLLGFDRIGDQPFTFEWIKPYVDKIYNDKRIDDRKVPDDYIYYYNTYEGSAGAHRGIIYILPK
jgi:predicted O-methyltransferase YrrM